MKKTMTYQIAPLMLLTPHARFDSLGLLWPVGVCCVVCVIRGDVKRSIVFDVVGYDTAVARGDLLFFFLFCFGFPLFFLPVFSGLDDRKTTAARTIVRRWETGTSVVVVLIVVVVVMVGN